MNPGPRRVVIYPKDICLITGLRERAARNLLSAIRKHCQKPPRAFITVAEFCSYTGIREELVTELLI